MFNDLKSEFKTSNGRVVYDGGGVDPDISIPERKYSSYSTNLHQSGLIFDYVSKSNMVELHRILSQYFCQSVRRKILPGQTLDFPVPGIG